MRRRYVKRKEGLNILHRERGLRIAITNEENKAAAEDSNK